MTGSEFDPQRFARGLYELVVLAVLRSGPLHGYEIALEASERTRGRFVLQHGTLYPILHRMEKAGWMTGEWSGGDGERRRKSYKLTPAGHRHLTEELAWSRSIFATLVRAVDGDHEALLATS